MVILPRRLRTQILAHARAAEPEECCGVLVGEGGGSVTVRRVVSARNDAGDPKSGFSVDVDTLLRIHRESREEGLAVVGYYHSHPGSPPRPSPRDREHAWKGDRHLIVGRGEGGEEIRSWVYRPGPREEEIRPW